MYNQMLDGNTAAELNNDRPITRLEERLINIKRGEFWMECKTRLLQGKKVYTYSSRFSLAERMADKYPEFGEMMDMDQDFMLMYNNGELHPDFRNLIETEAGILASAIVDEIT